MSERQFSKPGHDEGLLIPTAPTINRLNYGCGYDLREDWINVDYDTPLNGWYKADHYDHILMNHVLEHVDDPLYLMTKMWEVCKAGGVCEVATPYGSSDDAWENPHHKRPYFVKSFQAFGQAFWWRDADANYAADWFIKRVLISFRSDWWDRRMGRAPEVATEQEIFDALKYGRNNVHEIRVWMEAVKPARVYEKGIKPEGREFGDGVLEFQIVEVK